MNRFPGCENAAHFAGSATPFVSAAGAAAREGELLFVAAELVFDALLVAAVFVPTLNEHAGTVEAMKIVKRKIACFIITNITTVLLRHKVLKGKSRSMVQLRNPRAQNGGAVRFGGCAALFAAKLCFADSVKLFSRLCLRLRR